MGLGTLVLHTTGEGSLTYYFGQARNGLDDISLHSGSWCGTGTALGLANAPHNRLLGFLRFIKGLKHYCVCAIGEVWLVETGPATLWQQVVATIILVREAIKKRGLVMEIFHKGGGVRPNP